MRKRIYLLVNLTNTKKKINRFTVTQRLKRFKINVRNAYLFYL